MGADEAAGHLCSAALLEEETPAERSAGLPLGEAGKEKRRQSREEHGGEVQGIEREVRLEMRSISERSWLLEYFFAGLDEGANNKDHQNDTDCDIEKKVPNTLNPYQVLYKLKSKWFHIANTFESILSK